MLDIVITRYNEPISIMKPLLDSIALQRGIDFADVSVTIVNDGKENASDLDGIGFYPFAIHTTAIAHGGISAARNHGIDSTSDDYICFCDCDDSWLDLYALHAIFSACQEEPDMISSSFVEEVRLEDGTMTITRHDKDPTFIHGKVYKRSFLVEKNIRFDTRLRYHEDGAFNTVCLMLTTPKYIETPLYLWCWREGSVCRNESFVLKSYDQVMMQRVAVAEE